MTRWIFFLGETVFLMKIWLIEEKKTHWLIRRFYLWGKVVLKNKYTSFNLLMHDNITWRCIQKQPLKDCEYFIFNPFSFIKLIGWRGGGLQNYIFASNLNADDFDIYMIHWILQIKILSISSRTSLGCCHMIMEIHSVLRNE